jgi:formate--tetrahydrofolate ligase
LTAIVKRAYGGEGFELSEKAQKSLAWIEKNGFGELPVCVAKTQYSLSDDPTLQNAPEGFTLHVKELKLSAGAGFIVAICGDVMLMPGLGKTPTAFAIDVDANGKLSGLF